MKSLISKEKKCFVCGTQFNLHKHHIMKGIRNRKKAEEDGLWVYLCFLHHEGTNGVHGKNGHDLDLRLKRTGEKAWLEQNKKTKEEFIKRYRRNYLD